MSVQNPTISGNVIKTFFYYVVPSLIGLLAITSANLIDGIFVGNAVGPDALAAITLMIPYFTFLIATAIMIAIGGAVSAGKSIGEGDISTAGKIFSQSLIATALINLFFALISLLFPQALFELLKIPTDIAPLAAEYFTIIRWVFILQLTTMVLYYFVRADGHPMLATNALVIGALLNIALDAWFIFYLDLGLSGAAYATAIAQAVQFIVLSRYFFSSEKTLIFNAIQHEWSLFLRAAYNGFSEFVNEMSVGIIFFILNALMLARAGVDGVAAFTLVNYFIFLSVMLSYGFADALHLVISQNFGAKQLKRVKEFLLTAVISTISLGVLLVTVLTIWPDFLFGWFVGEQDNQISLVSRSLLTLLLPLFLVNGTNIILTCYLTAVHQPKISALLAITRSLLLPAIFLLGFYFYLPAFQLFPKEINDLSFIIALPISEWCALLLSLYFCYQYRPNQLNVKT